MAVRLSIIIAAATILALPSVAVAQHGDVSDEVRFEEELNPNEFMFTLHTRTVTIPNFVLGLFFDEHASNWSDGQQNFSYGGEFVWRRGNDFELGVALDYADLSMPEAFWKEEGESSTAADWTEIDIQVFSVVFSAYWFWDVQPWLTPFLGGGIGPGFVMGEVGRYEPETNSECERGLGGGDSFASPSCFEDGEPADDQFGDREIEDDIPSVVPMVNLTAGVRFNIAQYGVLKLETGIYPYAFAGVGFGAQF